MSAAMAPCTLARMERGPTALAGCGGGAATIGRELDAVPRPVALVEVACKEGALAKLFTAGGLSVGLGAATEFEALSEIGTTGGGGRRRAAVVVSVCGEGERDGDKVLSRAEVSFIGTAVPSVCGMASPVLASEETARVLPLVSTAEAYFGGCRADLLAGSSPSSAFTSRRFFQSHSVQMTSSSGWKSASFTGNS